MTVRDTPGRVAAPGARPRSWARGAGTVLAATAAALAASALYNAYRTRRAEREHPPAGRFVEVDGVRLHYLERGAGPPVVLLHGNVVTAEDWVLSGVLDRVAERHRVVAFDRPGYGHSDRPRGSAWTAAEQADLLRRALGAPRRRAAGRGRPLVGDERRPGARPGRPGGGARAGPGVRLLRADPAGRRAAGGARGRAGARRRAAPHGLAAARRRAHAAGGQGHVRAAAGAGALQGRASRTAWRCGRRRSAPRRRTGPPWPTAWRRCGTATGSCTCRW